MMANMHQVSYRPFRGSLCHQIKTLLTEIKEYGESEEYCLPDGQSASP